MNIRAILALAAASIPLTTTTALAQGPLAPPGAPAPTMKTLQQLWDKIGTLETMVTNQQQQLSQAGNLLNALAEANDLLLWEITNVTGTNKVSTSSSFYNTSLAFTPGGQPAISYISASPTALKYAVFNGSSWEVSAVTRTNWSPGLTMCPLAFTPGGQPAISYQSASPQALKYAVFNGTAWTLTNVEGGNVGNYNSLVFTPGGQPAISYYSAGALKYAVFNGTAWTLSTVESSGVSGSSLTSLAFTPGGQPAISYSMADAALDPNDGGLRLAILNGSTWSRKIVDSSQGVSHPKLVFTPGGQPAISYSAAGDLNYAFFNGGNWKLCTVAGLGNVGRGNSLAFTPGGQPAISYIDLDNDVLMFAVRKAFTPR